MKHLLVVGNPIDGFGFHGPFETEEEAVEYGENNNWDDNWNVAELQAPDPSTPVDVPVMVHGVMGSLNIPL